MNFTGKNTPLFYQFYQHVKQKILIKDYPPGSKLPTLREFYKSHSVGYSTIRKALEILEKEGLITRRRGVGTIVSQTPDITDFEPITADESLHKAFFSVNMTPLASGWVKTPTRFAAYFSEDPLAEREGKIFRIRRLVTDNTDPRRKSICEIYVPAWAVDKLGEPMLLATCLVDIAIALTERQPVRVRQVLRPWMCSREEEQLLGLPEGMPLIRQNLLYFFSETRQNILTMDALTTVNVYANELDFRFNPTGDMTGPACSGSNL